LKKKNFAFIDSQNLNLGIQKMGWKLDWRKFYEYLKTEHGVSQAYMFIGYMQENEALYEQMHDIGYLIVLKPTVESHVDAVDQEKGSQEKSAKPQTDKKPAAEIEKKQGVKGNTDADMVLYIMKELPNYHKAVIVSGDGDFFSVIEYLLAEQRLEKVLTPNWQYSTLLKGFDDHIVRLDKLRKVLAYKDYKQKKRLKK
jgi:uncharacterized LabA/DUF88 family protein